MMYEYIATFIFFDEAKPFLVVEPFHRALELLIRLNYILKVPDNTRLIERLGFSFCFAGTGISLLVGMASPRIGSLLMAFSTL